MEFEGRKASGIWEVLELLHPPSEEGRLGTRFQWIWKRISLGTNFWGNHQKDEPRKVAKQVWQHSVVLDQFILVLTLHEQLCWLVNSLNKYYWVFTMYEVLCWWWIKIKIYKARLWSQKYHYTEYLTGFQEQCQELYIISFNLHKGSMKKATSLYSWG